jgi:muramoyltetrapeptide carboxypeptidase
MKTIKPKKLHIGDTIGIISPSMPITKNIQEQFNKGVSQIEKLGFKVKLGKHVFDQHFYSAGTREDRINDFNELWADPEVQMILMAQGGSSAIHLLDGINYEAIKKNPKIFAAISDGSTLLNAIYAKTGLVTYHGPDLLWTFGNPPPEFFKESFQKTLVEGNVGQLFPNQAWKHDSKSEFTYKGWQTLRGGKASGELIGGHLGILITTVLAGYGPSFKGKILFLEGTDNEAEVDRRLTALELSGALEEIKGLVLGWFDDWNPLEDESIKRDMADVVLEVTKKYSFPILEVGEIGHNVDNFILPIGCRATIDADKKYFSIDESTVL